jgi:hypothetical protein
MKLRADMKETEYNQLITQLAKRDQLHRLAAYGLTDRMRELVHLLVECEVIPRGTPILRESLLHDG